MSNVPERKEGSTSVASGVDRLHGLKLVTGADGSVKRGILRIQLDDDLVSACRGFRRTNPLMAAREETHGESDLASPAAARTPISKILAFAVAGLLIGYFFGKHR